LAADLNLASQHFEGMLARIRSLDDYRSADDEQILALIERAETLWRPTDRRSSHAALYLLKGRVLKRLGRTREAVEAFERSLDIQSSPKRDTRRELATLNVSVS
jgi:tetratricopeptide (TPR) repeat protein